MKPHIFASFFSNLFAGKRKHLLSGLRGTTHEVSLMHEERWARLLWIFSMLTKVQQHAWQSTELCAWAQTSKQLPKVVETCSKLALGKAPLWQINIIISQVWMRKARHRSPDKPSCRQPRARVSPGFSHDVSTAPDSYNRMPCHPQNQELLSFSDQMGASTMCSGSLYGHCSCATLSNAELWTPYSQEIWNMESCRESDLASVCSTFVLEQIQLVAVGRGGCAGLGW